MAKKKSMWGKTIIGVPGKLQFPRIARPEPNPNNPSDISYGAQLICAETPKFNELLAEVLLVTQKAFPQGSQRSPIESGKDLLHRLADAGKEFTEPTVQLYTNRQVIKLKCREKGADGKLLEPPKCYDGKVLMPRRPGNESDIQCIEQKFYPGAFVRIACTPFSYEISKQSRGVSLLLRAIQFVKDGERIGGVNLDAAFAEDMADDGCWEEEESFAPDTEGADNEFGDGPNI